MTVFHRFLLRIPIIRWTAISHAKRSRERERERSKKEYHRMRVRVCALIRVRMIFVQTNDVKYLSTLSISYRMIPRFEAKYLSFSHISFHFFFVRLTLSHPVRCHTFMLFSQSLAIITSLFDIHLCKFSLKNWIY